VINSGRVEMLDNDRLIAGRFAFALNPPQSRAVKCLNGRFQEFVKP